MRSSPPQQFKRRTSKKGLSPFFKSSRSYETRLNRTHSRWRILAGPILSVLLGSLITTLPFFTDQPILPPFGFIIFIAWRFMRPGMWPMWAGLPFGFFDDIFSGALIGTAALTWSIAMLAAEFIDSRFIWRDHIFDWITASLFIVIYLISSLYITGFVQPMPNIIVILPQIIVSIALYPLMVRFCAVIDKWRLSR